MNICISLDGGTAAAHDSMRGPGSFDRTLRGLHFLKENGVAFDVQAILNRKNHHTLKDLFAHARQLQPGLRAVQVGFLNPVGRGKGVMSELGLRYVDLVRIYETLRREKATFTGGLLVKAPPAAIPPRYLGLVHDTDNVMGCTTCQFPLLGILPDGDVTVCALSRENPDLYFGNVRSGRLKEMWLRARMDMLRSSYLEASTLGGICGDCIFQKSCKGSCRAWAYETGGSFDAPFPICQALSDDGTFPRGYRISEHKDVKLNLWGGGGCSSACH
jgi:radical SAM protein with 4Fe4S-binding SPASM domain